MVRDAGGNLRARLNQLAEKPPRGPFRSTAWRSPLRGPWLTSVFAVALLVGIPVVFLTGLLSYAAYDPRLPGNDPTPHHGILGVLFNWPTNPVGLYRVTQGTHVLLGLALIPIVLAKLWSVIPKLFSWPPARSVAQLVERLSLALLVGGVLFELVTGVMNVQDFYVFHFSFYTAHYYGAWVFISAFVAHVAIKLPRMWRALRSRQLRTELATPLAGTTPEDDDQDTGLVAVNAAEPTMSRRGLLGLVAGSSLAIFVLSAGQTLGGPLRRIALLSPRGRSYGTGPNAFQVNKTAASVGIGAAETGAAYRLSLLGPQPKSLSRADLLALPQHTYRLPIACVEGWSTEQEWTGVRLADLARLAGHDGPRQVSVSSLQRAGGFRRATLARNQVADHRSLLALKVNGHDLSLDHGYPARVIVPALPGVHNTKWVRELDFGGGQ